MVNKKSLKYGIFSFLLVLLLMPIGHAIMILNEKFLHDDKYYGAVAMGIVGVILVFWCIKQNKKKHPCYHLRFFRRGLNLDGLD